jgi:hypothetical protein
MKLLFAFFVSSLSGGLPFHLKTEQFVFNVLIKIQMSRWRSRHSSVVYRWATVWIPIQWVSGALSLEVKRLGREADRSPPFSAEVKE